MKLYDIYRKAVKTALKNDPRGKAAIGAALKKTKKEFNALKGIEKAAFDRDRLVHPYDDSRVLFGKKDKEIKTVMVGIDIDVQEIVLADRLREKGMGIDLVISHHPSGRAFAQLDKVLPVQPGIWETFGLEKEVAEGVMKGRMEEVFRGISPRNHNRAVDAARLLNMPFMCLHTTADNCVATYLQKLFNREKPARLSNVMAMLRKMPEYRHSIRCTGTGPFILAGEEKSKAGKIFVDMTGGTNGPDKVFARLSQAGVKTVVGMHIKESGYKTVKSEFLNYIVAGHIASDNLGMNLLLDGIDVKNELRVIECAGFKRVRR